MTPTKRATAATVRLAGRAGFRNAPSIGIAQDQITRLLEQADEARRDAGMTPRQFMRLDSEALRIFASRFALPALEAKLAQRMATLLWQLHAVVKTAEAVSRKQRRRETLQ